jgi:hypothetical protein
MSDELLEFSSEHIGCHLVIKCDEANQERYSSAKWRIVFVSENFCYIEARVLDGYDTGDIPYAGVIYTGSNQGVLDNGLKVSVVGFTQ